MKLLHDSRFAISCFSPGGGKPIMEFSTSLKLNHIFRRLYHTSGFADGYLVLYARKNRTDGNRVGITVSKKLGKAHIRNRVRRRLREVWRLSQGQLKQGFDMILVARSRAVNCSYQELERAYRRAAVELKLWEERE